MALDLLSPEILTFIGYLAPFLITFVIFLLSIFNGSPLKGFIYLGGIMILSMLCISVSKIVKEPIPKEALYACRMFTAAGLLDFSTPSISTAIMTFTATYIMFPMIQQQKPNVWLFSFLLFMVVLNAFSKLRAGCTTLYKGIGSGLAIGILFALCYVVALQASSDDANSSLLLFSESLTNGQICSRPSEEQFYCKVYKDGELSSL